MNNLKEQIAQKLKKIENMIEKEVDKEQIEIERKQLDDLLEKYIKELQK